MATATLFDHLTSVREGDMIYVDVAGETLACQVDQIKIVLPNEIDDLKPVPGQDVLTLFTCTPYSINTHRLLVRGHRVPYVPTATDAVGGGPISALTLEPWMYGLLAAAALSAIVLAAIVRRELRRGRSGRSDPQPDPAGPVSSE